MKKKLLLVFTILLGLGTLVACSDNVKDEQVESEQTTPEVSTPTELGDNIISMSKLDFLVQMNDIRLNLWKQETLADFKSEINLVIDNFEEKYAGLTYSDFYNFYCEQCNDEVTLIDEEVDEIDLSSSYAIKIITVLKSVVNVLKIEENQIHLFNFINSDEGSIEELNGYLVIARVLAPTKDLLVVAERDALWAEIKTNTGCACNLFNTAFRTLVGYDTEDLKLIAVNDFITTLYCDDCEDDSELTEEAKTLTYFKGVVKTYLGNIDSTKFNK